MPVSTAHHPLPGLDVPGLIRRARRLADLSQRELAGALDVAPSAVARWETGQADPGVGRFQRLLALAQLELAVTDGDDWLTGADILHQRQQRKAVRLARIRQGLPPGTGGPIHPALLGLLRRR